MKTSSRHAVALALAGALCLSAGSERRPSSDPVDAHLQSEGESCLRCHEAVRSQIELPVSHLPASEGMCDTCHSPHAARFDHLLNKRERALCYACHAELIDSYQTGSVHTPVRQGQCVVCHQVHGSQNEHLLAQTGNDLCLSCHQEQSAQLGMTTRHEPFAEGDCTDCHAPHNSPNEAQLASPAESLCRLCHPPATPELIQAHQGIPVETSRCTGCHDPHAAQGSELLLPFTHEPFRDGSCDLCHMTESESPILPRATGARLCGACHNSVPRQGESFVHAPVAQGNCEACHQPHATRNDALLAADLRTTCTSCHADIEQRAASSRTVHPLFDLTSGQPGGQAVASGHKQGCLACHDPHSSTEENLLAGGGIRRCLSCHETMRHGHPLGEDRIDPRTKKGITCVTCHDPHGTDYPMQLRADQSRGLCLECHVVDADAHRK
jgi:predicted CXXCH cytochrome family protein